MTSLERLFNSVRKAQFFYHQRDFWIHVSLPNKAPNPNWTCVPVGDLKEFPKQVAFWDDCTYIPSFPCLFSRFLLPFSWKGNTSVIISQYLAKRVSCSNYWICYQKPLSVHDPLVYHVSNSVGIPDATVCLNCSTGPFYKIEILNPHTTNPCLNLIQP